MENKKKKWGFTYETAAQCVTTRTGTAPVSKLKLYPDGERSN